MDVHAFNIHTSRKFNLPYDPSIVYFETRSSNESALRWLVHRGFTKFVSMGQDPEGNAIILKCTLGQLDKVVISPFMNRWIIIDTRKYKIE